MHSGVSALAIIVFSIVTTIGCIPVANITYDNESDVLLEEIVPGKTERGDVHKILGLPRISNEEWGIEVYVRAAKFIEFTAPIPLFGIGKAIVPLILLYDVDGTVRTTDGVGEGYKYYTYKRVLLAPKSEFKTPSHLSPNECTLYLLPCSSEAIKINGNYLTKGVMTYPYRGTRNQAFEGIPRGYYRLLLPLGKYNITFFDNFRSKERFSKITINCVGSRIFYVRNKLKKSGFETILYDSPPNEMHKFGLIIYPAVPELIHLSDDKERAARGVSPNLSHPVPLTASEWALSKEISTYCPNAELGMSFAQKRIGDMYYSSSLIKSDPVHAYVWYKLAAEGGDQTASIRLKIVVRKLTTQQLLEAEQSFKQWKPGRCERDLREAAQKENE